MAMLEKWLPSKELEKFRHELDDLVERFGVERHGWLKEWDSLPLRPALESFAEGNKFTVRVDLPGIDPKDVDIKVAGGFLTIKGSREEKSETKNAHFFRRETHYGSFERSIQLPEGIKAEDLKATYRNGVLELTATMARENAPQQIKVQVDNPEPKKTDGGKKAA
ncbi:MAG: Hsp20/alpha crystallin family protein [Candidatus Binataceae bacterium]